MGSPTPPPPPCVWHHPQPLPTSFPCSLPARAALSVYPSCLFLSQSHRKSPLPTTQQPDARSFLGPIHSAPGRFFQTVLPRTRPWLQGEAVPLITLPELLSSACCFLYSSVQVLTKPITYSPAQAQISFCSLNLYFTHE